MQCFYMRIVELILNLLKQDARKGKLHVIKIRIIKNIFAPTHTRTRTHTHTLPCIHYTQPKLSKFFDDNINNSEL